MTIKSETVQEFIAEAEKELADILHRKADLEDLIKKCKALFLGDYRQQALPLKITMPTRQPKRVTVTVKSLRRDRGKKLWEQIKDILKEVGGDLSVSNIAQEFRERGWPLSAKPSNALKIIYRAMKDKPELFRNTNRGTWDLVERFNKVQPRPIPLPEQH